MYCVGGRVHVQEADLKELGQEGGDEGGLGALCDGHMRLPSSISSSCSLGLPLGQLLPGLAKHVLIGVQLQLRQV